MKQDYQKLAAGKQMDMLILKDVFGLENLADEEVPTYSTSICDAMDVVHLLSGSDSWNEHPFDLCRNYAFGNMWTAAFNDYAFIADAETPALAICRAALMAVNAEDE